MVFRLLSTEIITIMSEAWQNYLQLRSLLWQTANSILCTHLHCWDGIVTSPPIQPLIVFTVWDSSTKSSKNCSYQLFTAITNHKITIFSQSSTSNSSPQALQWLVRCLVIFFRPQHPLCPQPDFFFSLLGGMSLQKPL